MHKILTKWIEPYVLLETLKKEHNLLKVYNFDGFSKNNVKQEFLKHLKNSTGLYMKNVNNFYLFEGVVDIETLFGFTKSDYELTDDIDKPFEMVDMGKAEAGFIYL
jgi:hypothetical protein